MPPIQPLHGHLRRSQGRYPGDVEQFLGSEQDGFWEILRVFPKLILHGPNCYPTRGMNLTWPSNDWTYRNMWVPIPSAPNACNRGHAGKTQCR